MGFCAFGDFTMTRVAFLALLPHEKTELALLLEEYAEQTGGGCRIDPEIARHARLRHHYALPGASAMVDGETAALGDRLLSEDPAAHGFPKTAARLLLMIAEAGPSGFRATQAQMAQRVRAAKPSVISALSCLRNDALILRVGRTGCWSPTERGCEIVEALKTKGVR